MWLRVLAMGNDNDRATHREHLRKTLADMRRAALERLESRGYEVRGKTPDQIRRLLKRRPSKQKINSSGDLTGLF
jgi:hypothetical protein